MRYIKLEDVVAFISAIINQGTARDFKKYMKEMSDNEMDEFISRFVKSNLEGKIKEIE